jgi:enamine deaminase RidA (YjgF/YER057c/UK114 family)
MSPLIVLETFFLLLAPDALSTESPFIKEGLEKIFLSSKAMTLLELLLLNLLSIVKEELGDINKVKKVVKLLGFVSCTNDFYDHPQVINGASDLLVEVFGEKGKHARSAIGTNVLPLNLPVEIEMVLEIEE